MQQKAENLLNVLFIASVGLWSGIAAGQEQLFIDDPPPDYFRRQTLTDCEQRFYSTNQTEGITGVYRGETAKIGELNYFAAVGWTLPDKTIKYQCGGTLITLKFVLTAAHCNFDGAFNQPDTVRLGDVNLLNAVNDQNSQQIRIKAFIRHPQYTAARSYNDIGLIELAQAAVPSPYVCTACLWTSVLNSFAQMTLMGFGATGFAEEPSPTLLKATLGPIDVKTCTSRLLPTRRLPNGIADHQFCAGAANQDACQGDSGGPLTVQMADLDKLVPFVVGIISLGISCGEGSIGVYTKVASFKDWIESTTKASFDPLQCGKRSVCRPNFQPFKSPVQRQKASPSCRVSLLRGDHTTGCGGTLIDYRHVLTSAHCVNGTKVPTHVEIHGAVVDVKGIEIHPEFVNNSVENDMAVIKLGKFLNYQLDSRLVLPACLWKQSSLNTSEVFIAAYDPNDEVNRRLIISSNLIDPSLCGDDQLCSTNRVDVLPGACQYEPGGHVSNYVDVPTEGFIPFIYGVNSKGADCGGENGSFVAAKVSGHFRWIEAVVLNSTEVCRIDLDESFQRLKNCVPGGNCYNKRRSNKRRKVTLCRYNETSSIKSIHFQMRNRHIHVIKVVNNKKRRKCGKRPRF